MASLTESKQLVAAHQGLVRAIASRISRTLPPYIDPHDVVGYGQIGLAEAAASFDPSRGVQFSSYAHHRVRGAILNGLREMSWFVPETNAAQPAEGQSSPPSVPRRSTCQRLAIEELTHEPTDPDNAQLQLDSLEYRGRLYEILASLPEHETELLRLTYARRMPLAQVAEQLGVSRSWASRLHARVLQRIYGTLNSPIPPK